jgi:antitoxin (DNA-binding transcriptional repressor) of toxin-antitoxin stability system
MKKHKEMTEVSAYNAKTRQAELFRRAAAGEVFLVTDNGKPQLVVTMTSDCKSGKIKQHNTNKPSSRECG